MRKVILMLILAIVFASCSNNTNTTVSSSDSTIVDSLNIYMDSLDTTPYDSSFDDSSNMVN